MDRKGSLHSSISCVRISAADLSEKIQFVSAFAWHEDGLLNHEQVDEILATWLP